MTPSFASANRLHPDEMCDFFFRKTGIRAHFRDPLSPFGSQQPQPRLPSPPTPMSQVSPVALKPPPHSSILTGKRLFSRNANSTSPIMKWMGVSFRDGLQENRQRLSTSTHVRKLSRSLRISSVGALVGQARLFAKKLPRSRLY